jgi:uncharacterized protein (DUF1697 family)
MKQWIAFLRAINVGGHNVKMEQLRTLFEALGFANVTTFIASGNVIFEAIDEDAQALERQIERQLYQTLGYQVATFLRSPTELAAIATYQPFPEFDSTENGSALFIAFLPSTPSDAAAQKLLALRTTIDDFCIHKRELYWLCRAKASESTFSGARLEKTLGMPATVRNSTTVRKLAAKYPAST